MLNERKLSTRITEEELVKLEKKHPGITRFYKQEQKARDPNRPIILSQGPNKPIERKAV